MTHSGSDDGLLDKNGVYVALKLRHPFFLLTFVEAAAVIVETGVKTIIGSKERAGEVASSSSAVLLLLLSYYRLFRRPILIEPPPLASLACL